MSIEWKVLVFGFTDQLDFRLKIIRDINVGPILLENNVLRLLQLAGPDPDLLEAVDVEVRGPDGLLAVQQGNTTAQARLQRNELILQ
jgi:hypothetical protein